MDYGLWTMLGIRALRAGYAMPSIDGGESSWMFFVRKATGDMPCWVYCYDESSMKHMENGLNETGEILLGQMW